MANPFAASSQSKARIAVVRQKLDTQPGDVSAVVVGAGRSGLAAKALLQSRGATVRLMDDVQGSGVGPIDPASLAEADLVVLSPGVPRSRDELQESIKRGVLVGEIELASWWVSVPMIGITGTNGKSTVTALVTHIISESGRAAFGGGNLGRPLSELVTSGEVVDVAVVELSSYQLESIVDATFDVACWLNVSPDHADRYVDVHAYAAAKQRILDRRSVRGVGILNARDPVCSDAGIRQGGRMRWFSTSPRSELAGAHGVRLESAHGADPGDRAVRTVGGETEHYDLSNPCLPGLHNRANMCAAIECARYVGVSAEHVQSGLLSFSGLPHRLENVGSAGGARWFNDSKATNVESAITALRAIAGPKILIAGGKDKGAPWTPFQAECGDLKAVLAIGEASGKVVSAFSGSVDRVEDCGTLDAAVRRASEIVSPGDAVLLAPACSSFDQFDNYAQRGDVFRDLVRALEGAEEENP